MAPIHRLARPSDVDRLVEVENSVFETDRISRRSFRNLIERETARTHVLEIDGVICGYCMVLFRKGVGVARLYSIAVDPACAGRGYGRMLLAVAEDTAYRHDCMILRLEVRADNERALQLYERCHYRRIGIEAHYYEDGGDAIRMEKSLRVGGPAASPVPYYAQTTDFTCGPCCLMMAKAHFEPLFQADPVMEIRLWREATTVFMMSGPGGCEPFGLAIAAHEHGLAARILVSTEGPLFLNSVRSEEKRRVMDLAQIDFRRRAQAYGIPVAYGGFWIEDIKLALARGELVAVLISGFVMFGKKVPHWVLAIADDGDHIMLHDPWVEDERGETVADAADIPVPYEMFMRMAQFGRPSLRAAVVLGAPKEK